MLYESTYYGVMPLGDTIEHSGVKGMKWYKRRWQNLDGSLTPAGRVHYGVGGPRKARTDKDAVNQRSTIHYNAKMQKKYNLIDVPNNRHAAWDNAHDMVVNKASREEVEEYLKRNGLGDKDVNEVYENVKKYVKLPKNSSETVSTTKENGVASSASSSSKFESPQSFKDYMKYANEHKDPRITYSDKMSSEELNANYMRYLMRSKPLLDLYESNSAVEDPNKVSDKEMDHSKSNNSERIKTIAALTLSTLALNPVYMARNIKRLGESASANAAEKKEEQRRNTLEVDEKTGLHKKSSESSPDDDMKAINPAYNNFNTNTKQNCMLCSTAYELRRRGYDVQANKASTGFDVKLITRWFPDAKWVATDKGPTVPRDKTLPTYKEDMKVLQASFAKAARGSNYESARKTITELEKQPNGSRGNIVISWGGGGAHSMVYEIENGKAVIRDCQANITYRNPEEILRYSITTQYCRTDNLKFDEKRIKEAVR